MKIQHIQLHKIHTMGEFNNLSPKISCVLKPSEDIFAGSKQKTQKSNLLEKFIYLPFALLINKSLSPEQKEKEDTEKIAELQQRIEKGNDKFDKFAFKPLHTCNPVFNNISDSTQYIGQKIQRQAGVITEEDIEKSVKKLSMKYKIPEQEVIDIMTRLTQFGSYKQLKLLGKKLGEENIGNISCGTNVSLNRVFNYIQGQKQQMILPQKIDSKTAYIIDDFSIKTLEKLSPDIFDTYKYYFKEDVMVPIILDGTGVYVGDKNYSDTVFDGGKNLEALTEAVILQMRNGKTLDEILNGNYRKRVGELFGKKVEEKILTVKLADNSGSIKQIAEQLKPNLPDKQTLDSVFEVLKPDNKYLKKVVLRYLDNMIKIYSPDTIGEVLKQRHKQLEEYVESIGKTMEDVFYIVPCDDKSYNLIDYTYCKVNNIDPSKFINLNNTLHLPQSGVAVILDDVIGSGDSMLDDPFNYDNFVRHNPNTDVVFSAINVSKKGLEIIEKEIQRHKYKNPSRKDFVLHDDLNISDFKAFQKTLSSNDVNLLRYAVGFLGHIEIGLCTAFPYMIPDNCSEFSAHLLDFCLNYSNSRANKASHDEKILMKIKQNLAEKQKTQA